MLLKLRALKLHGMAAAFDEVIDEGIKREIDEATEKCKASPPPPMELIMTDVYADGGFAWRN